MNSSSDLLYKIKIVLYRKKQNETIKCKYVVERLSEEGGWKQTTTPMMLPHPFHKH